MRIGRHIDLTGNRYGALVAVSPSHAKSPSRYRLWDCLCDCGEVVLVDSHTLTRGQKKACGIGGHNWNRILADRPRTPAKSNSSEYSSWQKMKTRCLNPRSQKYPDYGGRGITIHQPWVDSFDSFLADMGLKPTPRHTVERTDNDGNYEPGNCRWATGPEQRRNQRRSFYVEWEGRRLLLVDIASEMGLSYSAIAGRLKNGWDIERALTTPIRTRKSGENK